MMPLMDSVPPLLALPVVSRPETAATRRAGSVRVFFGFWLSHVPLERFASSWEFVADCLKPGGRVFFVDDGYRTPDELIEGEASSTILRRLNDGTTYRTVKVPQEPTRPEERLATMGWRVKVTPTSGPFN